MVDEVPAEAWERMVDFYRELIDRHGWRQAPMLDYVSWLAAGPYGWDGIAQRTLALYEALQA